MPQVPVGNKYTTTLTGSAIKHVTCSYCGCQFVYQMKREASGEATSLLWLNNNGASYKSTKIANDKLNSILQEEIDARSCPDCGMYQENMVHKLKGKAWRKAGKVALSYGIIGSILVLLGSCWLTTAAPDWPKYPLLCVMVGLWFLVTLPKIVRAYRLDPNARANKRIGRVYSERYPVLRRIEFENIQRQQRQ
jgi:hypothetical protein